MLEVRTGGEEALDECEPTESTDLTAVSPGYRVDLATLRFDPGSPAPLGGRRGAEPARLASDHLPAPKPQPQL